MNAHRLTCACCGASVWGRQWRERDYGYGVCRRCFARMVTRGGVSEAEELYGKAGVHHSLPEHPDDD